MGEAQVESLPPKKVEKYIPPTEESVDAERMDNPV